MTDIAHTGTGLAAFKESIGRYGVWSMALRLKDPALRRELNDSLAELEEAGYRAVWLGGSPSVRQAAVALEESSTRLKVGTSITSIWDHEPEDVARECAAVEAAHPGRFMLGLGVSHAGVSERYHRPYSALVEYLDALDAAGQPAGSRVLAALGPRTLRLARDRSAGSLPYMSTPEHTARAREALGSGALLAPEVKVVLESDPATARAIGRSVIPTARNINYVTNFLRIGFTEDDLAGGGSDRLVDAVIVWGDEDRIKERLEEHFAAGADHIALQVIGGQADAMRYMTHGQPLAEEMRAAWRRLAGALID